MKKQAYVPRLLCALLAACLLCYAWLLARRLKAALPEAVEVYAREGVGLPVCEQGFGLAAEQYATLGDMPVYALATNSAWGHAAGLRFVNGGYFLADAVQRQQRYLVLPDSAALHLFGTEQAAGADVCIDGERYLVCGVYQTSGLFLDEISRSSLPVVYLSRPVRGLSSETPAQLALLPGTQQAEGLLRAAAAESGARLEGTVHDVRAPAALAFQLVYLAVVACALVPVFWLMRFGVGCVVRLCAAPQRGRAFFAGQLAAAVLAAAAGLGALWLLLGNISVPGVYLPPDNLFDFSFYSGRIVEFFQMKNAAQRPDAYTAAISAYLPAVALGAALGACLWFAPACGLYRAVQGAACAGRRTGAGAPAHKG